MNLETILDDCLLRVQQGEAIGACLERYPQQAAELKPMLVAAARLRTLSAHQLSAGQRLKGQQALRRAWAVSHTRVRPTSPAGWLSWLKAPVALGLAALLLFVVAAASTVAASRPGDPAYPARVAIERVATWPLRDGQRVVAELAIAERRLADVQRTLPHTGQADLTALRALVSGDEAAASGAATLPTAERNAVAERIATHAASLSALAEAAANDAARQRLALTATQLQHIAGRLRSQLELDGKMPDSGPMTSPPVRGSGVSPWPTTPGRPTSAPEHTPRAGMPPSDTLPAPSATPTRQTEGTTPPPAASPSPSPSVEMRGNRPTAAAATMTATRRVERTPEPSRYATAAAPRPMPGSPPAGPTREPATTSVAATPPSAPPSQPPGSGEPPTSPPAPPPQPTRHRRP